MRRRGVVWTEAHERFWALVDRAGPVPTYRPELGQCWLWTGQRRDAVDAGDDATYGKWRPRIGEPKVYVHRFALGCIEALVPGLEVDHLCRVRLCCNPRHLEQVTPAENRRRQAEAKPAAAWCRNELHEMTEENTIRRPGRGRACRACRAATSAAHYQRTKETSNASSRLRPDRERAARQGSAHEAQGPPATRPATRARDRPAPASRRSDRADPPQRVAGRS